MLWKKPVNICVNIPPAEMPSGEYEDIIWKALIGSGVDENGALKYMAYFLDKAKGE